MKTKPSDILTAIFLAPVALVFGLILTATFVPIAILIFVVLLVALPLLAAESAVCYAMGWPDWSKRQERRKVIAPAKHTACDCPGVSAPSFDCCNMPAMPDKLSATISPAAYTPPVCKECLARHQTNIPNARSLGNAWCHECGAEYEVLA